MRELERWIIGEGLRGTSVATLLNGFVEQLLASGIPLMRVFLALPTVNPTIRVYSHTWTRTAGTTVDGVSHERNRDAFEVSPFGHMLRSGQTARHWHFSKAEPDRFALFDDIEAEGGRDYLARLVPFDNASAPALLGIAISFSTDRNGGFSEDEVASIDSVLPALALASYRMTLLDVMVGMLDTYVGLSAGRRVLSGEIQRGSGTTLTAALLFADLRGFTALADRSGAQLIHRLDQHLEAMAEPVVEYGGEVLKFLGDGLMAAFLVAEDRTKEEACAAAVRAARAAIARNEMVNLDHADATPLDLDVALHFGDVFYGNIGAANRLDFTVIGPAVNEVSRMEALCEPLGCNVILSASVAAASAQSAKSLGRHALRGVSEERELFALAL